MMKRSLVLAASLAVTAAQAAPTGRGFTEAIPYAGNMAQAVRDAAAGTTIPMASFTTKAAKTDTNFTTTIVGASPFASAKGKTVVHVLVVPVIVQIGTTSFDPTAANSCVGGGVSPLAAFTGSPLLKPVVFDGGSTAGHGAEMNGVDPGAGTYPDMVRRAEFWSVLQGTKYHTLFKVTRAAPFTITAAEVTKLGGGNVLQTGCGALGVLPSTAFHAYMADTVVPGLKTINPKLFPFFLFSNVVTTSSTALTCQDGCTIGYHAAIGTPVQTYGVGEYDSTQKFWNSAGITDISILAHEMSEWMDDPLVTNGTPPWGGIGQQSGCQSNWEVGDPLTGTDFPAIKMRNGLTYHPQELAFYSWYFNAETTVSLGAGGKFSSNGTFGGPAKVCPPGGTY